MIEFPTATPAPALYQVICGALQEDGTLPADFALPRPNSGAEETQTLRFADGAFDGISLYHMAPDKRDIKSLTEILGLISAGAYDKAAECLQLFFSMDEYISMLPLIDDLQSWIIDHKEQINAQVVYEFSAALLKESPHIESIKFALSCLELMDLSGDESTHVRNLIRVLALSDGISSDFRDLDKAAEEGNEAAQLALDKFAYEVRKYIGAYTAALGGLDCLVFTAGVGENSGSMRASICEGLEFLGVKLDAEKNKLRGEEVVISTPDSKVKVWVIPTNEELMIAQDTAALCK